MPDPLADTLPPIDAGRLKLVRVLLERVLKISRDSSFAIRSSSRRR